MANIPRPILLGLVDASGAAGATIGSAGEWRLVFHLAAWHVGDGPISQEARRCELPVHQDELRDWMAQIEPYQIVAVEPEADVSERLVPLRRIVSLDVNDPALAQIAAGLQQPITLPTKRFGTLRYERRYEWFAATVTWGGAPCELTLSCADPQQPDVVLAHAEALFAAEATWRQRIVEFAVTELLDQAEDWRDEDEPPITREAFLERMTIESINVDDEGQFSFMFNDGELFAGHAIQVTGDLASGPTHADTPG